MASYDLDVLHLDRLGAPQTERCDDAFDGQGWRDMPSFDGDYYREPNDVVRGVCLAQAPPAQPYQHHFAQGLLDDDFCSGLWGPEQDAGFEASRMVVLDRIKFSRGGKAAGQCQTSVDPCGTRDSFAATDTPPDVPSDPFFKLEKTTLYISSKLPSEIGNRLLHFLRAEVVSSVTKVSREKFAIKADVFIGAAMSNLKIRVYSEGCGTYAVEFQRRRGDGLSFDSAYRQAIAYLESHFGALQGVAPKAAVAGLKPPSLPRAEGGAELAPLLDLLACQEPVLQAEALGSLAELVRKDAQAAFALRTTKAFEDLERLVESQDPAVLFPASRLFALLQEV